MSGRMSEYERAESVPTSRVREERLGRSNGSGWKVRAARVKEAGSAARLIFPEGLRVRGGAGSTHGLTFCPSSLPT